LASGDKLVHHLSHWGHEPQANKGLGDNSPLFLHAEEHLKQLPTVLLGWIVSLDDGLNQVSHGLWLLGLQGGMVFTV
jgi:hypothetical protein